MASPAGTRVNIIILPFTLLSGIVVFFRLFTRFFILRNAGREDLCISLAMVWTTSSSFKKDIESDRHSCFRLGLLSPYQSRCRMVWANT